MIACEIFRRHVDAVVDGEVDPTIQIEFEQHLAECGPCRVHLSFARAFKRQLREAVLEDAPAAPPELADRIRKALDAEDTRRAAARGAVPVGANASAGPPLGLSGVKLVPVKARYAVPAAAAAVALAVVAASEGGNPVGATTNAGMDATGAMSGLAYLDDVVQRHTREHPPEVSGPPRQVATWFQDKLEFPVKPIEFGRPDVRLVGARISSVRDREAAAFYYDVHGRRVTVMVFQPPSSLASIGPDRVVHRTHVEGRGIYYGHARGRTIPVVQRQHHGLTYAIAGDLEERALLQLAASVRIREH